MKNEKHELIKKEELKKEREEKEMQAYKDELAAERDQKEKELKERYEKLLADLQKENQDVGEKFKQQTQKFKKLKKNRPTKVVVRKPAMKETVLKTLLSLVPVVGPLASGVYERFSSP